MPLFMIEKEYFDLIQKGEKDVELRKVNGPWKNAQKGDEAIIMCGSKAMMRKKIKEVYKGSLQEIYSKIDYHRIFPNAKNMGDAIRKTRKIYPKEEEFTAFVLCP